MNCLLCSKHGVGYTPPEAIRIKSKYMITCTKGGYND